MFNTIFKLKKALKIKEENNYISSENDSKLDFTKNSKSTNSSSNFVVCRSCL